MGMTLDEAIKKYIDNAEYERTHGNLQGCLDFRQLAEWLRELKMWRAYGRRNKDKLPEDMQLMKALNEEVNANDN